jgi:hypothetical protein
MYGTTKENAERLAARFTELARVYPTRPTNRYVVEPYPDGTPGWTRATATRFGVVRRWHYADRPELGEFGGEFMRLDGLVALNSV